MENVQQFSNAPSKQFPIVLLIIIYRAILENSREQKQLCWFMIMHMIKPHNSAAVQRLTYFLSLVIFFAY